MEEKKYVWCYIITTIVLILVIIASEMEERRLQNIIKEKDAIITNLVNNKDWADED